MTTHHVTIGHKHYVVHLHDNGRATIHSKWVTFQPTLSKLFQQRTVEHTATIDPSGRLGKRILARLRPEGDSP